MKEHRKYRYTTRYFDSNGRLRWRFRRPGYKESQTTVPFESPEWLSWYAACLSQTPPPIGSSRTRPGSIDALVVSYVTSADFTRLKPSTQTTYRGILDRFRDTRIGGERAGCLPAAELKPHHIRRLLDASADRPAAANNLLKILRVAFGHGVERELLETNPAATVRPLRYKSEGFHTWTEAEIAQFEAYWPLGAKQRLAFDLLLYTGQRSGDVRAMGPQHVCDGVLHVVQEKTGERLQLPVHPNLRASLDATPTEHLTFLVTKQGQPYTAKGFSQWVSEAANKAGLDKECSGHGLRKAAARRLAEAGCSTHQIMAVTGHKSLKEVERYTREAGQKRLAEAAIGKLTGS